MTSKESIQIPSLQLNVDEKGDIVGSIALKYFIEHLQKIPPNKRGFLDFRCEKRRTPVRSGPDRSHTFPIFQIIKEVNEKESASE